MLTILLIDEEKQVRCLCQTVLEAAGFHVLLAETGRHGLQLVERQDVTLALVDMRPGLGPAVI